MTRPDIAAIRDHLDTAKNHLGQLLIGGDIAPTDEWLITGALDDIPGMLDYIAELEAALAAAQNTAETISSLEGQKGNW